MDYTCQALLSVEFCRQKILEWVAISFSREPYLTQGLNPSLLHCRWILYWLSYQGDPNIDILSIKKKNSFIPLLGKGCEEDTVGSYPGKLSQSRRTWWGVYSNWFKSGITHKIWVCSGPEVSYLIAFSYCSWDSWGKNTGVACCSLFQWTMFCQIFFQNNNT